MFCWGYLTVTVVLVEKLSAVFIFAEKKLFNSAAQVTQLSQNAQRPDAKINQETGLLSSEGHLLILRDAAIGRCAGKIRLF